jgi:hypothetical protein
MTACATLIPTNAKAATIIPDIDNGTTTTTGGLPSPSPSPSPDVPEVDNPYIVPEPLTIFGTATALGWGVLLKRKSFKKKKS